MKIDKLKQYIQSANIHFMIGSGASRPYLATLGSIETWLTQLAKETHKPYFKVIEASIYKCFYESVIRPNFQPAGDAYDKTVDTYRNFLKVWNSILNKRYTHLLHKQVNLFTTNIDLMTEYAASGSGIELNDGFKGSVEQLYDESNFSRSIHQTSHHFRYTSEVPVFNLLKIHGSVNWAENHNHQLVNQHTIYKKIDEALAKIPETYFVTLHKIDADGNQKEKTYEELVKAAEVILKNDEILDELEGIYDEFLEAYRKFIIVNPTKRKFVQTVMDYHFYELMRIYANSLEIENSLLFVIGFSFADEHIALITKRVADSNPTLQIVVFAYSDAEKADLQRRLDITAGSINNNITILTPSEFINDNTEEKDKFGNLDKFDFSSVVRVFSYIEESIYGNNK